MGFGWLFIGYFISTFMVINQAGCLIRPIGYAMMLWALYKLKDYHRDFWYALAACSGMLVLSLVLAVEGVSSFLAQQMLIESPWISAGVKTVLGYVEMIGSLVFHATLLWGIRAIARETEVDKISFGATRNFVFFLVYNVLYAIALLPLPFAAEYAKLMSVPVLLLYFACIVLNLILIFSCYARICDVADEDMAVKPSRFAFVNRMREKSEARRRQKDEMYAQHVMEKKKRKEQRRK